MKMYKPKKSLGQNFLKSADALRKIIKAGEIKEGEAVLEIGPGKGVLTEKILASGAKVVAVEKDDELLQFLKNKFEKEINSHYLVLVHCDILNFNPVDYRLKTKDYKIIANIPYNITGAILKKFLAGGNQPERMVLMVQNEVAKRILATDGKESVLSISVKTYGEPKMVTKVPRRYFSPAPRVDSAVIIIKNISKKAFEGGGIDESKFWRLVKAGFAHKRKVLANNLGDLSKKINWGEAIRELGLQGGERAQELGVREWLRLLSNTHNLF